MARPSPTMPPVFRTPAARRFEELEVRIGVLERLQGFLQSKSQEESHTATTVTARWHRNGVYLTPREAAELATQERRNLHRASEHLSTVVNACATYSETGAHGAQPTWLTWPSPPALAKNVLLRLSKRRSSACCEICAVKPRS